MRITRFLVAAAATSLMAGSALATEVSKQLDVAVAPDKAWEAVGAFCGIGDWHPAIEKCELSNRGKDTIRTLTLKGGGGTIVEKLVRWEPKKHSYTYAIISSPLPVSDYVATLSVAPARHGSRLMWKVKFKAVGDEAKARDTIAGIFTDGLAAIARKAAP